MCRPLFMLAMTLALGVTAATRAVAATEVVATAAADLPLIDHPASDEVDHEAILSSYLDWFFRQTDGKRLKKAKTFIPQVVTASLREGLDPLLTGVNISYESTWNPSAVGSKGEVGLMQVHGKATEGFDVTTIDGNLAAGCRWLASRIRAYGLVNGMAAYINSQSKGEWRVRRYEEAKERYGYKGPPLLARVISRLRLGIFS